jgi:hypothetical protein
VFDYLLCLHSVCVTLLSVALPRFVSFYSPGFYLVSSSRTTLSSFLSNFFTSCLWFSIVLRECDYLLCLHSVCVTLSSVALPRSVSFYILMILLAVFVSSSRTTLSLFLTHAHHSL